jgi:hypothetical protein
MQKSIAAAAGTGRGDCHVCALKDVGQSFDLLDFIFVVVLYDAQTVHPKVFQPQVPGGDDGILDCLGQLVEWDRIMMFHLVLHGCHVRLFASPGVTQHCIFLGEIPWRLVQE